MTVGEKLKAVRTAKGMTLKQVVMAIHAKSPGFLSDVENGNKEMSEALVSAFRKEFSVRSEWWETGTEPMFNPNLPPGTYYGEPSGAVGIRLTEDKVVFSRLDTNGDETVTGSVRIPHHDMVQVPVYDSHASAGPGAFNHHEEIVAWLSFSPDFAATHFNTRAGLVCLKASGNSMEPTINPGDVLVINTEEKGRIARDGAMYLLRMGDTLSVKRVTRMKGNVLNVTSDNPNGPNYYVNLNELVEDDMEIIGRVVFYGIMG